MDKNSPKKETDADKLLISLHYFNCKKHKKVTS